MNHRISPLKASILVVTLAFSFLLLPVAIFAQDTNFDPGETPLIGVNCGVPGGQNGTNKCCYNPSTGLPHIPGSSVLENIWVIGGLVEKYENFRRETDRVNQKYSQSCIAGYPDRDAFDPTCTCQVNDEAKPIPKLAALCDQYIIKTDNPNVPEKERTRIEAEHKQCVTCANKGGYWSALQCVPLNLSGLITATLLGTGIGLGGLIAFFCILYCAFIIQTSRGNAEQIEKARENLTSCIIGLLLIIFSVFILRFIGVDILQLPGFGI